MSEIRAASEPDIAEPVLFEAVIMPHRSLSRRGLRILLAVLAAASALTILQFWLIGAWPVAGFSVLEIGLAGLLIRWHVLRQRESELLLLTGGSLRILRTDRRGQRVEQTLPATWLAVVLEDRPGRVPRLLLTTHGRHCEVAASLGELEKRDLAAALRDALHRSRNRVFDNPQLRPDATAPTDPLT